MPHDMNDKLVSKGDRVLVPCIVTAVQTGADYCNVTVETEKPMHPGDYKTGITLNTRQVMVVDPPFDG